MGNIDSHEPLMLGPCELPLSDQWLSHTHLSQISSINHQSASTINLVGQQQQQQQQQQTNQSQSKIMNVVASQVACPSAPKKIRRKSDNKPQSQINKCNNEKRRREQENEYIEQLGEFLQINKRDMTSSKPDKAAILNEVVKTYCQLLEKGSRELAARCTKCPPNCADSCTVHPVQQGEVSSTEPPLPEPSVNGQNPEISAYFEAVEHYISSSGWALLKINAEGIIETVTENIKDLIGFTQIDLQRQPIYSYLHPGDHAKLSPTLNNMSFALGWEQDDGQPNKRPIKSRIRMLVKHPDGANETMEQKQQRQDKYEELVIFAAPFNKDTGDDSSPVLCLITRPEDELPIESTMQQRSIEQFTLKIDTNGNIINVNAQGLRNMYASNLTKDTPKTIMDLCHIQDLPRLEAHINEVKQLTLAMSSPYRLRIGGPDKYVHVKANSRLFRGQRENEFIMSVNTILSDNEVVSLETMSCNTTLSLPGTSHSSSSSSFGMGGPLMTSVINGNGNGTMAPFKTARANSSVSSFSSPPTDNLYSDSFDFPLMDTFDIDPVGGGWDHRPDSRTSVTPVSTPRPPSVPAFSPAASICPSPLTSYHSNAGQPSPSNNNNNNNNNNNINNNNTSGYSSYSYLTFDDKDAVKDQILMQQQQQQSNQQQQQSNHDSERLRLLLTTKRPHSNTSSSDPELEQRSANKILKGLLNADEDKDNKFNQTPPRLTQPAQRQRHESKNTGNNMLLQLLNEKSDEDDGSDARCGLAPSSELLKQLQKSDSMKKHNIGDAALIQKLQIQGSDYGVRDRSHSETDDGSTDKRPENKPSKLREKNKMLASLLSNPSRAPASFPAPRVKTIPDIPQTRTGGGKQMQSQQQQQMMHHNRIQMNAGIRPQQQIHKPSDIYLNLNQQMPTQDINKNQHLGSIRQQPFHVDQPLYGSSPSVPPNQQQSECDPELSDILNIYIELEQSRNNIATQQQQQQDEAIAITEITKSLIECEKAVGCTSADNAAGRINYSGSPPAYPVQSGNLHTIASQQPNNQQNFPQPPNYNNRQVRQQIVSNPSPQHRLQFQQTRALQQQQQQKELFALQKEQKERLLQQQQKQSLVVPSNATAGAELCITNYESLLNNVPPNVSLQRSNNVVPDSQLSPGFTPNMMQLSPNQQRAQFSPQPNSVGYQQFGNNGQVRLSPQQQQQMLNQQMSFQAGAKTSSNPQLSPRTPTFSQSNPNAQTQPNQPQQHQQSPLQQTQQQQQQQWSSAGKQPHMAGMNPTATNPRLSMQQQQNPMLNAQLQISQNVSPANYPNQRQPYQAQRQRSINSPGATATRQNSFTDGFPGPPSPTQNQFTSTIYKNPMSELRLLRQTSVPQATQHLPGGNGNINSSEFVRQELRAVVNSRSQQSNQSPLGNSGGGMGQGPMVGNNNNNQMNLAQQQMPGTPILNTTTDPTLGFNFEMTQTADYYGGSTNR
ncbi:hypothetical protein HA402_009612 [Bradysia odoriphaga]|nr:hypothetical protein HA402_009612 [Bradysia odoriphaga]